MTENSIDELIQAYTAMASSNLEHAKQSIEQFKMCIERIHELERIRGTGKDETTCQMH